MSQEAPRGEARPREQTRTRRWLKHLLIVVYMIGLAHVPYWLSVGFPDSQALAEEPELRGAERERFRPVSWDVLGGFPYEFEMPGALEDSSPEALAARNERLIPPEVRALDRLPIAVRGYVIPVTITGGRVTEFILAAKNEIGCCFGSGLSMNQWIHVVAQEGRSFDLEPFEIATVLGLIEVGEEVRKGTVLSLYRMREATVRSG